MRRRTYLIFAKTFGLAGCIATIADIAQPLAPIATYVMGASAISLAILVIAKIMIHIWNEKMAVATYFASGLFFLSSTLYFFQAQSLEASTHGAIASELSELAELQRFLGMTTKQLKNIEHAVSSIDTHVANLDRSVSSVDKQIKSMDVATARIDNKLSNIKRETSTDPRKELANMGMRWEYDNFLEVLRNKDERAILLYLEGGMKLRKDSFVDFVTHMYSKPATDMLLKGNALEDGVNCPNQVSFYKEVSKNRDKVSFVNSLCATHISQLIKEFDRLINAQEIKLTTDKTHNARLEKDRDQCIDNLKVTPAEQYIAEIENYDYGSEPSIKKTVLTRLKGNGKILRILAYKNVNQAVREEKLQRHYRDMEQDRDVLKIFNEVCMAAYPDQNKKIIDTSELEQLSHKKRLLSQIYAAVNKEG